RPPGTLAAHAFHRRVRDPLGVRIGVPVAAHRGDERPPRPRALRARHPGALSAQRSLRHLRRLCRPLPPHLGAALRSDGGMSARIIAPVLMGLFMLALWEGLVRAMAIPPYILPGPILVAQTLVSDWGTLWPALV